MPYDLKEYMISGEPVGNGKNSPSAKAVTRSSNPSLSKSWRLNVRHNSQVPYPPQLGVPAMGEGATVKRLGSEKLSGRYRPHTAKYTKNHQEQFVGLTS
jgi:hypothetical protein